MRPFGLGKAAEAVVVSEGVVVLPGDPALGGDKGRQLLHLRAADRSLQVRHAIIVAHDIVVIVGPYACRGCQMAKGIDKGKVVSGDRPAAAGGSGLVAVERIHGQFRAEGAGRLSFVEGADRGGPVDHHGKVRIPRDAQNLIHIRRDAEGENGQDRRYSSSRRYMDALAGLNARIPGQGLGKQTRIERPASSIDIEEPRGRAAMGNRVGRGDEGQRRTDDEIARPHAHGKKGGMKRCRAGGGCNGLCRACGLGNHRFEARDEWPDARNVGGGDTFGEIFAFIA